MSAETEHEHVGGEDGPEKSPNLLARPKGLPGIRRLNKMPLAIAGAIGAALFGAVVYTARQRAEQSRPRAADVAASPTSPDAANAQEILRDFPAGGVVEPGRPTRKPSVQGSVAATPVAGNAASGEPPSRLPSEPIAAGGNSERQQERDQIRQARFAAWQAAQVAPTSIGPGTTHADQAPQAPGPGAATPSVASGLEVAKLIADAQRKGGGDDQNKQSEKREFLEHSDQQDHYLHAVRTAALSPFEVKQGAVIPAVLIAGVNSDLPGQLLAQVAENVWDTATGRYLLIPQGAKLVGTYDSQVTPGQERVLVVWNRIIYPDASAVDLGPMPGADESGYSGFNDKVNNHYWKIFSAAILMSAFSAGAQLSQPQPPPGQSYSATQVVAGSMGQQLGQVGAEIARRNMAIQPTLEIRPGYRFVVMVNKDMVLQPWRG